MHHTSQIKPHVPFHGLMHILL
uniref:Uncharacterized protein n=1 Tax=Arundo donax TaxID=35708 RepID=A0A0A9AU42_ARUDO